MIFLQGMSLLGQNPSSELEKLEVILQPGDLESVFRQIERQTQLGVAYDTEIRLKNWDSFSYWREKTSLKKVLDELSGRLDVEFELIGKTLYVREKMGDKRGLRIQGKNLDPTAKAKKSIVSGRVKSTGGEVLVGARVYIQSLKIGTLTDREGKFSLQIPGEGAFELSISYYGFEEKAIPVGGGGYFEIVLDERINTLNEVVVIGYQNQLEDEVSTAISRVDQRALKDQPVIGFDQALAGKMPGVRVIQSSGAPGSGTTISVRGVSSITAGTGPLYVVDGVVISDRLQSATGTLESYTDPGINPLSSININDIESITVLKDAAAAAIYGSRGANGVVLIKTKRGEQGEMVISYNGYAGLQQVGKKIQMLDAYQYAELKRDGHNAAYMDFLQDNGLTGSEFDSDEARIQRGAASNVYRIAPELTPYLEGQPGLTNTNWQDEIFRNAPMTSHTLGFSGGNEHLNYYSSTTFLDQRGVVIGSGYKQYSGRFNLEADYGKVKMGFNMTATHSVHDRVKAEGPYWADGVIGTTLVYAPIFPAYNEDGSYNFDQHNWEFSDSYINPVALAELSKNDIHHNRLLGNVFAEYTPLENLVFRSSLGVDINDFSRETYRPKALPKRNLPLEETPGEGRSRSEFFRNWLFEQTASYEWDPAAKHHVNFLLGFSAQQEVQNENYLSVRDFPNDLVSTTNAGLTVLNAGSKETSWSLLSYFGRVQYQFNEKYYASAVMRMDGSSRFGEDSRWGFFPSFSMGYLLSEEEFIKKIRAITFLKLRASYGIAGNYSIGNAEWLSEISEQTYVLGTGTGKEVNGYAATTLGNKDLRWEKSRTYDIGFEIGLFRDRVSITADYYHNTTSDLLLYVPVPQVTGFASGLQNIGKVRNQGFEALLNLRGQRGKFGWEVGINGAMNRNKVLGLGPESAPIIVRGGSEGTLYITTIGQSIGSYYTYVRDGIFNSQEEIEAYPHLEGTQPGDPKVLDLNQNGEIDEKDRAITGSYFPDFTYGFNAKLNYGNFDFSMQMQGVQGNEVMNLMRRYIFNMEGHQNNVLGATDRWQSAAKPGDGQTVRANRLGSGNTSLISNWMVEDGSFLRITNLAIGYTFQRLHQARLYTSMQNPFTFTNYIGYNPEVNGKYNNSNALVAGEDYGTYPLSRTLVIGVNLNI